jgi:hypothetical protein
VWLIPGGVGVIAGGELLGWRGGWTPALRGQSRDVRRKERRGLIHERAKCEVYSRCASGDLPTPPPSHSYYYYCCCFFFFFFTATPTAIALTPAGPVISAKATYPRAAYLSIGSNQSHRKSKQPPQRRCFLFEPRKRLGRLRPRISRTEFHPLRVHNDARPHVQGEREGAGGWRQAASVVTCCDTLPRRSGCLEINKSSSVRPLRPRIPRPRR